MNNKLSIKEMCVFSMLGTIMFLSKIIMENSFPPARMLEKNEEGTKNKIEGKPQVFDITRTNEKK